MRDPSLSQNHRLKSKQSTFHQFPAPDTRHIDQEAALSSIEAKESSEIITDRIVRVQCDLTNLKDFWKARCSPRRAQALQYFLNAELEALEGVSFGAYDQNARVDYLLLKNFLTNELTQLRRDVEQDSKVLAFMDGYFPARLALMIDARQKADDFDAKQNATLIVECLSYISTTKDRIVSKKEKPEPVIALRATKILLETKSHFREWSSFYDGYDPMFSYWVSEPYQRLVQALQDLSNTINKMLLGLDVGDEDTIVGEPIGFAGISDALESEIIPYTPEELIEIGQKEYKWCENEMQKAAGELGFSDWRNALEHVKTLYVEPGKQPQLVHELIREATDYVKEHDLVTVPPVCEQTIRTFMMSPKAQKMNPFFLGGDEIIVSYPTSTMSHEQKLMSLRGNNVYFSRATVFHEMIPGHHLHMHYMARHRPYRQMFQTSFCIEGWAFYWEMVLWASDSWKKTPENRIGMLFWRMHRCARIIFSLKYHLGKMSAEECVQLLVDMVGHERATAEGEVRRSVMGDYGPLYQAGYMLGGLQLYALRQEVVEHGDWSEKQFHDTFLKANQMPVELFRALLLGKEGVSLNKEYQSQWKFYSQLERN